MENFNEQILDSNLGESELEMATTGQRFGNYIIDLISFYALLMVVGVLVGLSSPEFIDTLVAFSDENPFLHRLLFILFFVIYISIMEGVTGGKSLGKYITKTRAVNDPDGTRISMATAFKRGFSRAVPFEQFSALGNPSYPWHDKWTNTLVVREDYSTLKI
jgi:uncharacterized RDD family membrane protein YckC